MDHFYLTDSGTFGWENRAELTAMRSSLLLIRTLLRFQNTVGSGCPRGGTHSSTAGSPAATTTSLGACRKSSLRTKTGTKECN